MGESLFLNEQIHNFSSSHPHEAGWRVYEFQGETAQRLSLHYLLDFVQISHPECLKRRVAVQWLADDELNLPPGIAQSVESCAQMEICRELKSDDWFGQVDIEWLGFAIHFVSFLIRTPKTYTTVYHAATRSNAALRLFTQALQQFGQARQKDDARYITVMNGPDIPIAPVAWDDIVLPEGCLDAIRRNITTFFDSAERYKQLGIPHRRGLLFAGPPGSDKTLTLKALAHHTAVKFITVSGKASVDDSDIQGALDLAAKCSPAVVLFEDLDKLVEARDVSLAHFLNSLDGLKALNGVVVIATCNEPEKLDPALLFRPSRFDRIWTFPLPPMEQRLALLRKRGEAYFSEPALEDAARRSHGFSMAYVQEIVVNALLESAHNGEAPSDSDLLRSLDTLRSQRKDATRKLDSIVEPDGVGFALPNGG